jgi:beta-N-acetylhexosaminidase
VSKQLQARGVKSISTGAGASRLLWHGVPDSLKSARRFFEKHKFIFNEVSYDLIQDISQFTPPSEVLRAAEEQGVSIEGLRENTLQAVLAFQAKFFPDWHGYFHADIQRNGYGNVLLARRNKEILGSVLLSLAPECPGGHWRDFLGPKLGALGILGVSPDEREKGIGLALAARATEALRNRGVVKSFVHWTWLRDWYGKLGYKVWEQYDMGKLLLST